MRKDISPDILFLSETKNPNDFVLRKLNSVDYPNHLLVPLEGHGSGGLALFWKAAVDLSVTTVSLLSGILLGSLQVILMTLLATKRSQVAS